MTKRIWGGASVVTAFIYICTGILIVSPAFALQSANYHFDETTVGSGGLVQSSSTNFQSSSSISDTAVGESASTNFQTQSGSVTTNDPALSFTVNGGSTNFTTFSPSTAATANSTFSVSNYTSFGYIVQMIGTAPTNGSHTITAMGTTGGSTTGTEQFGVNVVANTSPTSFGANPVNNIFGTGVADPNYSTPNSFRYVSGETIASAPKSSGVTTYTISYIANVNSLTPGGVYQASIELVCIGTY